MLDDEPLDPDALFEPHPGAARRRREGLHRRHRLGLAVHRAEHAAGTAGGDLRRQPPRIPSVHDVDRHAVAALLGDPRGHRAPRRIVERHPQSAATAITGRAVQLAIQLGPAAEAREGQRALGRIASHHAHAGGARTGGGGADLRALEHDHARARLGAAQVPGRAKAHETTADDHHRGRHRRQGSTAL